MSNDRSTDLTDITKAVMTSEDGEWFIIPAEHVDGWVSKDRESVIVHKCRLWNKDLRSENQYRPVHTRILWPWYEMAIQAELFSFYRTKL